MAFNMDFGLFRTTPQDDLLYPNPASELIQGREHTMLFGFLGRILGKALYEGLTVEPKFAHFFLSYLKGNYNYLNTWHDLSTLDGELSASPFVDWFVCSVGGAEKSKGKRYTTLLC